MYLKEIEIKGFKSFANKMKLNITPGITVIVGPNGCGKSNITDAVRWILGEQNIRSLRGSKVTDMIYTGNDTGKMSNYAEVSILFDNEDRKLSIDSEEIQLKRIVYRSGEIENYINNAPCKLKDIHELFWGTGLGRSSYSIIAQGKVDFVLSAKPTERRILFEEASNISSYNNKKEITLKKLEQVENNLLRINDILSEVKENLVHYKKKADDLKLYQSYTNDIKKLEFFLLSQQYFLYQGNIKKNHHHLTALQGEITNIEKMLVDEKKSVIQTEKEKENLERLLSINEEALYESEKEKNNANNLFIVLKQKKIEVEERIKGLNIDNQSAEHKLSSFKNSLSDIDAELKETIFSIEKIIKEIYQKEDKHAKWQEITTKYESLVQKTESDKENFNENSDYRSQEKKIKDEMVLSTIKASLVEIKKENIALHYKSQNNKKWLIDIQSNIASIEKEMNSLRNENSQIEQELTKNKLLMEQETEFLRNMNNDLILKNKEKEFLEEFRKCNQNKDVFIGEELLDTENKKDLTWIGEAIHLVQSIPEEIDRIIRFILNDKIHLLEVISFKNIININQALKSKNRIQVKIITDNLMSKQISDKQEIEKIMHFKKVVGFANQLISFPCQYNSLFEILLGYIIIVEDIETALMLSNQLKGKWIIVSLDGMMIDTNGMIILNAFYGNNFLNDEYLITEKIKQIEKDLNLILDKIKQKHNFVRNLENENRKSLKEYNEIRRQIDNNHSKLYKEENLSKEVQKKILEIDFRLKKSLEDENNKENQIEKLQKNILISQKNMIENEKYKDSFRSFLKILLKLKDMCIKEQERLFREVENMKMKLSWSKERESILQKRKNEMNLFLQNYQDEKKYRQEKLDSYSKEKLMLVQQEIVLEEKLKIVIENKKRLDKEKVEYRNFIKNKEMIIRKIREDIEDLQRKAEDKKNRLHQDEIAYVQNQEKMDNLIQAISNQYNASINEILLHKNEANSNKEASEKIAEYKSKISLMGQINFDALQEFQQQSSRFNDLQFRRDEIIKSKEKLIHLVHEIDRIAENHFYQTFLKVEAYFKEIFQKLFRGGQVSLELIDHKKLLETGIEVMVQPPGKKLQNISLLSTGEKALTAIALLFALWKANPSPFCFFDEIDSALDEANALRLASFLRNEDLKNAQIIIITHQKGVMEAADALYGITMEGSGVSKLMSVRMVDSGDMKN